VPSFGVANAGAYYIPLSHRIQVSRAYLARLSDAELRLILAHEVGHATRRWKAFARRSTDEEVAADRVALRITGSTPDQWRYAVESTGRAEPGQIVGEDVVHRASALGLHGESCRSSVPK
jgi:Zn-dependent protease with chaperone function